MGLVHCILICCSDIQACVSLIHQHIFLTLGWCKDADNAFLVMCLCKGGDLQQLLHHKGRLDSATARNLFRQLGESLVYLHKRNICHRDLKLSNLLLNHPATHNAFPQLQLADFGLAVRTRNEHLQHTFCGTPNFLPPEVRAIRCWFPSEFL